MFCLVFYQEVADYTHLFFPGNHSLAAVREFALQYRGMVYLKGGHDGFAADDLLFDGKDIVWLKAAHISNNNTHGTGAGIIFHCIAGVIFFGSFAAAGRCQ